MKNQQPIRSIEQRQIINDYIDNDPTLRNLRRNLLDWNARRSAGIGHAAAGEIIYCIGRLLTKKDPQK